MPFSSLDMEGFSQNHSAAQPRQFSSHAFSLPLHDHFQPYRETISWDLTLGQRCNRALITNHSRLGKKYGYCWIYNMLSATVLPLCSNEGYILKTPSISFFRKKVPCWLMSIMSFILTCQMSFTALIVNVIIDISTVKTYLAWKRTKVFKIHLYIYFLWRENGKHHFFFNVSSVSFYNVAYFSGKQKRWNSHL